MTCRSPYLELAQFQKDVAVVLPNSKRINRGGYFLNDLVILCLTKGLSNDADEKVEFTLFSTISQAYWVSVLQIS
jgi:hypothetical protein